MKSIQPLKRVLILFLVGLCLAFSSFNATVASPKIIAQKNPSRIVALTSLTADIIQKLNGSKLVGIPGSQLLVTNPNFRNLTKVSEGRTQPNLEKILALKPDLVIGAKGFHEQTASRLNRSGIATELVDVDNWESLAQVTRDLATKVGGNPTALLNQYQSLAVAKPSQSQSVLVLVSRQPILSPNRNSWAGAMLDRFYFKNVAGDLQGKSPFEGYVTLSAERLLQLDPDNLIVVETGEGILAQFQSQSFWRKLKAVQQGRVYQFDYYGLVNPGSIEAIVKASEKLREIALKN